jgi:hypothetical protein
MKLAKIILCFLLVSITVMPLCNLILAQSLVLTLATSKSSYDLGDPIVISGNLTLNGSPVTDALVAVQVRDPRNQTIVMRTLKTGTDTPSPTIIEIFDFFPCDGSGNIQTSFARGSMVGFTIKLQNHASSSHSVFAPAYIQYADSRPFMILPMYNGTVAGGAIVNATFFIQIPDDAPVGTTNAYASALTDYPQESGYAYSPENATAFQITIPGLGESSGISKESAPAGGGGNFSMSFITNRFGGLIGNYTIYATTWYQPYLVSDQETFKTVLTGDITGPYGVPDLKVDARDISRVARAYGSRAGPPPSPNWDPKCDFAGPNGVPDGKVDARDVSGCARNYGKHGTLP